MLLRAITLIFGPVVLIATCYGLTANHREQRLVGTGVEISRPDRNADFDIEELAHGIEHGLSPQQASSGRNPVAVECDRRARTLAERLGPDCRVIVRPPFIVAGDLPEEMLDRQYHETIVPTVRALSLAFFDHEPTEPITLLLFASDDTYQGAARKLDQRSSADYHGYYIRPDRRIVLNLSTGEGTLAHELTHALAHADFPNMPEWFDEGLASLFEEASFSDDGLLLLGQSNWRLNHLLDAMQNRKLSTLESLASARRVDASKQQLQYAQSRYFCLFLQDRGLLPFFYRKFRARVATDPSGFQTLCDVFGTENLDPVDREFRQWVIDIYREQKL
jgi:hypothetical protein